MHGDFLGDENHNIYIEIYRYLDMNNNNNLFLIF